MVFRGRPSRGCERCRKARVKCDEERPGCSRCLRLNWPCTGYRKLDGLMVLDETEKTKSGLLRRHEGLGMKLDSLEVDLSLGSSGEDVIVWHFYYTIMASLSKVDHAYHLHSELPNIYAKSHTRSALCLSTQAIAYAVASKSGRSTTRHARSSYALAISAMKLALQNPEEAIADETLYAVLLLCGYETITCDSDKLAGWAAHVRGAAALLIHRSKQPLTGHLASKLYHFARRSIILYQIQTGTSVTPLFDPLGGFSPPDENDEDRLFSLMARLSEIQHCSKSIADRPIADQRTQFGILLGKAKALESSLLDWQKNLPSTWAFNIAQNLHGFDSANSYIGFVPVRIHKYPDIYTARLWNLYRVSRIILHFITIRMRRPNNVDTSAMQHMIEVDPIQAKITELVNDICASVPFLCGKDLSRMRSTRPNYRHKWSEGRDLPVTLTDQVGFQNGRYSLLWPLYVASSVKFIPESQRAWMRQQMLSIAEGGEPLASWLADSQCQTLTGGRESFAIDCV